MTTEENKSDQIRISTVTTDKKQYLSLLLIGDEQESMIDWEKNDRLFMPAL